MMIWMRMQGNMMELRKHLNEVIGYGFEKQFSANIRVRIGYHYRVTLSTVPLSSAQSCPNSDLDPRLLARRHVRVSSSHPECKTAHCDVDLAHSSTAPNPHHTKLGTW
jgi:hypothetical protein